MATDDKDNEKRPVIQPSIKEERYDLNIDRSKDSDWSNYKPAQEGYRPTEDTTESDPPSDSGTTDGE